MVSLTLSVFNDLDDAGRAAISARAGDEASASVATPVVSRKLLRDGNEGEGFRLFTAASGEV
jgi:hypothetical protein